VFDVCWSVGGRLFQAAGAAYENARWPNFNRVRGCSTIFAFLFTFFIRELQGCNLNGILARIIINKLGINMHGKKLAFFRSFVLILL